MAAAIASYTTANNGAANRDVVLNKPTGLTAGDTLVACITAGYQVTQVDLLSGWTSIEEVSSGDARGHMMYKVADAGDVAASTFTFTGSGGSDDSPVMLGALFRITGLAVAAIPPTYISGQGNDVGGVVTITANLVPVTEDYLLIFMAATDATAFVSHSGYTISGPTNPTWTEYFDDGQTSTDESMGVAAAIVDNTTTITGASVTLSGNSASGIILAHFAPQQDATGNVALLSASPAIFAPSASSGTTGTAALLEGTPTANSPTGTVDNFRWTNESDTTTTWTNES